MAAEQKGGRERWRNGEREGLHAGREGWREERREGGRKRGEGGSTAVSGEEGMEGSSADILHLPAPTKQVLEKEMVHSEFEESKQGI